MKISNYIKTDDKTSWGMYSSNGFKSSGYHMPSTIYDENYYLQYNHSINMIFTW